MSSTLSPHRPRRPPRREPRLTTRAVRRGVIAVLLICTLLAVGIPTVLYAHARMVAPASRLPNVGVGQSSVQLRPADLYMRAIVTDDGALGWRQLCPALRAQLPLAELVQQANAEREAAARQGVRVTATFATMQRQRSGVVYVYVATAHWSNGVTQKKTFDVITQPSGCVEDVRMR